MREDWMPLEALHQEIREVYLSSERDWVVAYSGGKDSTATLQLLWYALSELPPEQRKTHIYIISNDTLVEDPAMALRARLSASRINEAARAEAEALARQYPEYRGSITPLFSAHILQPELSQRFFFLLIGKGYPAPTARARWCVSRLKLGPAQTFIEQQISTHGEVVVTLGAREEESTARAISLRKHALPGQLLKRHSTIRGTWVYTPIEVWEEKQVWIYLLQIENPWGEDNRDLAALYQASSGECPLIVDRKVSSCAGTRTGCWTCTVTSENRSLANRVDAGEDWLIPLLEFREFLLQTTDPAQKHRFRTLEARSTHLIQVNRQGRPSYRCYTLETRKDLLRRLLAVQERVRNEGPDPALTLIDVEELCAIREVWRAEGDWEDSLPVIYREITGHDLDWPMREDERWMNEATKQTLLYHCQRQDLPEALVLELFEAMRQFQRAASAPFPVEKGAETGPTFPPLFENDPATTRQQQAMERLIETIGTLFHRRDWRDQAERLEEVLTQYAEQQAHQHSSPVLGSWSKTLP